MLEQQALEAVFLDNLALINRLITSWAHRNGVSGHEAEDLASGIRLRLLKDDYAVFRRFRGESSLATYLTMVIASAAHDYCIERWGRWRPSAIARRLGRLAVRIETLVYRRGYSLAQVGELLRTSGETLLSDRELAVILKELPTRSPLRPVEVGTEPLEVVESEARTDSLLDSQRAAELRARFLTALAATMSALPVDERLVLQMRFWEAMSIADIARGLNVEKKPLYRRLERLLANLRRQLAVAGFSRADLRELLEDQSS